MRVRFAYHWTDQIELPDKQMIGVFSPRTGAGVGDETHEITEGLDRPIGAPRLRQAVREAQRILILADDISRPTPVWKLVPPILSELEAAGKHDRQISFLMSLGTHRPMTLEEIDQKLGPGIRSRFRVTNHAWNDPEAVVDMGRSSIGTPILVNRLIPEADFVLGIGNIVPHPAAGFSGGGKIVDPGCVSDITCGAFHWESVKYPPREIVGRRDNPISAMIDEVASKAGLRYIVNTVLDASNRIMRVVAGHPVEAHRVGCQVARSIFGVSIPELADIVLCDSHPADLEMWQAIKGLCAADLCLKDGGWVIMATPCPEGTSSEHPELALYGYRTMRETECLLSEGKVSRLVAHHLVQGGRLRDRAERVFIVSPHLTSGLIASLGFHSAPSLDSAVQQALASKGPEARISVLQNAAELFPILGETSS
jgi:nickel-dependent lactate racemase